MKRKYGPEYPYGFSRVGDVHAEATTDGGFVVADTV